MADGVFLVTIQGNFIGTNAAGTVALGNKEAGVIAYGQENKIGGTAQAERNVISGNLKVGAIITGFEEFSGGSLLGNYIGTDATGTKPLGNGEEGVGSYAGSMIGGTAAGAPNLIAYNGKAGVMIAVDSTQTSHDVRVVRNSIFSNGGLGIDVQGIDTTAGGITPNDPGDTSDRAQNFPLLADVSTSGNTTMVTGTLNSRPSETFTIEFFSNPTCDPSGNGEGQTFIGSTSITTNSSGAASFTVPLSFPLPSGHVITATATSTRTDRFGTSEFSPCLGLSSRLANISTRLRVETGDNARPTTGKVTSRKNRTCASGTAALRQEKFEPRGEVAPDGTKTNVENTGLAPSDFHESAILTTLPNGNYTAIVAGYNGGTGVGLVEVYNLR